MEQMPKADAEQQFVDYSEFTAAIRKSGHFVACNRLLPPPTATPSACGKARFPTTDGPYVETKEQLGGLLPHRGQGSERGDPGGLEDSRAPGSGASRCGHRLTMTTAPLVRFPRRASGLSWHRETSPARRGDPMKYLCLVYMNERTLNSVPNANGCGYDRGPRTSERDSGRLIMQASLGPARATTTVRPRNGKPSITDGPFTETKEQVGGFFIYRGTDLNQAILVASKHPAAHLGEQMGWGIEVRPVEGFEQP